MARNNEPAFRRKTPLLICSIRTEIPYPCIGSSANVFRMSISSVPWTRSLGLSGINLLPPGYQEEHTLLLLVVKRRSELRTLAMTSVAQKTTARLVTARGVFGLVSLVSVSGNGPENIEGDFAIWIISTALNDLHRPIEERANPLRLGEGVLLAG